MLEHLAPLLNHYASRINVAVASHAKGMQVTIAVMPCPQKVTDETLRQQLIQPIVVVGDAQSISNQLAGLKDSFGEALANEQVNASVEAFNAKLNSANSGGKTPPASKPAAKTDAKAATPTTTANETKPAKPAAQGALDDFLAQENRT